MKKLLFTPVAFDQYNQWQQENKQVFNKLKKLLIETAKTPFEGTGKPEPLNMTMQDAGVGALPMNIGLSIK
jgi:toxin YoeB